MIIESIIKRKAGTTVQLGDITYFFNETETEPRHLAEVKDEDHIARFLSVKEGFREAEGKAKVAKPAAPVEKTAPAAPVGEVVNTEQQAAPQAPAAEPAPVKTQKADNGTEFDRDAALAEAKALKIKSAHLFGNEKLALAIAAAKANA